MPSIPPVLKQIWISSGVIMNLLGLGFTLSYPYCLLPALRAPESTIKASLETGSWIASSGSISMIIGIFMSSYLMQRFGRKMAHILLTMPSILSWIITYFASNITTIMIGRIVGGIGTGSGLILGCTVIGEYADPKNRGMLIGCKTASLVFGNLIMHVMSQFFEWRTVAALSMIPFILVVFNTITWPESPMWLASKGKYKESESIFYWLRGEDEKSKREFENLIQVQNERIVAKKIQSIKHLKFLKYLRILIRKDIYKPLGITFFGFILLEGSGRHSFPAFASDIIGEIQGGIKTQIFWFTLAMDITITISSILSFLLARVMKRRLLLFVSGVLSIAILACICLYLIFVSNGMISNKRSYIPISLLFIYFVTSNLGCVSLPITIFGEIYPLAYKGYGTAVGGIVSSVPTTFFLKVTPGLLENFKVQGTFAIYSLSMTVALIYLYFYLPETHNKTLQEIEDFFNEKLTRVQESKTHEDENVEMISLKSQ